MSQTLNILLLNLFSKCLMHNLEEDNNFPVKFVVAQFVYLYQ